MKYPETKTFNLLIIVAVPPDLENGEYQERGLYNISQLLTEKLFKPLHSSDIQGRERRGIHSTLFDPRPSKSRKLDLKN